MKYLLRAAGRLSAGAPAVRPAIPSRSPLAALDQRLNLDSFASRFDLPSVAGETAAPSLEEESSDFTGEELQTGETPAGESRASRPARHRAATTEDAERPGRRESWREATNAPPRARTGPEGSAHASLQRTTRAAGGGAQAGQGGAQSTSPQARLNASLEGGAPVPHARRANPLPDPSAGQGRFDAGGGFEAAKPARGGRADAGEAAAESVLEALNRAMSWVESGARRAREAERDDQGPAQLSPQARTRASVETHAAAGHATPRDARPVTHLEIGKIEVEVVAPSKPVQNHAPARPAQRTNGFSGALRQTFGWRQR